jgi:hypothetical protein
MACSLPADCAYSRMTGTNWFTMSGDIPKLENALATPATSPLKVWSVDRSRLPVKARTDAC